LLIYNNDIGKSVVKACEQDINSVVDSLSQTATSVMFDEPTSFKMSFHSIKDQSKNTLAPV